MKKLLIGLVISLTILVPFKVEAQPISDVGCEAYNQYSIKKYLTSNYRIYLCKRKGNHTGLSSYYYLGGMRNKGVDYYIHLPYYEGDEYGNLTFRNNNYSYTIPVDGYGYVTIRKNGNVISQEKIYAVSNY